MKNKAACKRNRIEQSLRDAFGLSDLKNELINSLVNNLVWQIIKLDECRAELDKGGLSQVYERGDMTCDIQSPYMKTYNDFIKNYNVTIKTLINLVEPGKKESNLSPEEKAFLEFANRKKKSK